MDPMNVNTSTASQVSQSAPAEAASRPDGANLFNNRNVDQLKQYAGEPLEYDGQEAHNPKINKPGNVPKNTAMQNEEISDAALAREYENAVLAGIKERVADKTMAQNLAKAFLSGQEPPDEALAEQLALLMNETREEVNEAHKRKKDEPIPKSKNKEGAVVQNFKEGSVKEQMKNYPDLFVNGKLTDKGYQTLRKIMTGNIEGDAQAAEINKAANKELGFTPKLEPHLFQAKIGAEFEQAFQDQIANLPEDQQKKMEYLFNNDPEHPDVKGLVDKAVAEIQGKWGADVQIVKENLSFNFKLNGEYQFTLDQQIKKLNPELSQSDIAQIKNYLIAKQNGKDFQISGALKAIGDKAEATALASVQALYGAPKSWAPDNSITLATFLNTPQGKMFAAVSDQIAASEARINSLPAGPEKSAIANLIKIISRALSELKEMLFQIAAKDAASSSEMSRAQVSLVEDKVDKMKAVQSAKEKEKAKQDEIAKKEAEQADKQKWMGPLMIAAGALLSIVAVVATALTFGATAGLIALAITVVILILTLSPSGTSDEQGKSISVMSYLMNGLNKGIDSMSEAIFGEDSVGAQIFGTLTRVALIAAAVAASAASGNFAIVAPLLMTFIMESGFIERMVNDIAKASGNEEPPAWVAAIVSGVVILTIIVAMICCKGGGGSKAADKAAKTAKGAKGAANTGKFAAGAAKIKEAGRAAKESIKASKAGQNFARAKESYNASKGLQISSDVVEGIAVGTQVGVTFLQANTEFQLAQLKEDMAERIRETSDAESEIAEIEAMIKMLQKVIDSLFGNVEEMTEWAKETGKQMDQRWADKTELMTNLNAAQ